MGLDMYFYKKSYVKNYSFQTPEEQHEVTVLRGGNPRPYIKPERVSSIVEQIAYFRKFNALHHYIVENMADGEDNCQQIYLGEYGLERIVNVLQEVKDLLDSRTVDNEEEVNEQIQELFPPQSGFFFGSTDIDEYFKSDVEDALTTFKELLDESMESNKLGLDSDYYYQANW